MTDNMDEFDQEQFDASEPMNKGQETKPSAKESLMEAWRNKPIFKLVVIMVGVGAALALVLGTVTPDRKPIETSVARAPALSEAPGGEASPFFIEQNTQANMDRADSALHTGGSAMPTPVGHDVTGTIDTNKKDPLVEFREETERLRNELRAEQQQNAQQLKLLQQQMAAQTVATNVAGAGGGRNMEDDSLARAMQKQMESLMDSWTPRTAKFVNGYGAQEKSTAQLRRESSVQVRDDSRESRRSSYDDTSERTVVPAGTVNYIQLLTEANSDIPGPILAQILSGPLSGGRAIGRFQVQNDYLVLTFNLVSHKGKEYQIDALALDPDTTLGGMATEVDHRYFSRVLLPAAGSFISAFGQAMSETDTSTTVNDGSVVQDKAKKGMKEAIYQGIGEAGDTISQFFKNEANNIKTLVRVAVGTPMGLFFLTPVTSSGKAARPSVSSEYRTSAKDSSGPYATSKGSSSPFAAAMQGMPPEQAKMMEGMMSSMMGGGR